MDQRDIEQEMRSYVRMDVVFPVELTVRGPGMDGPLVLHGYSRNVSEGGLRVECGISDPSQSALLRHPLTKIGLRVEVPFRRKAVEASGVSAWVTESSDKGPFRFACGVRFTEIRPKDARAMLRYAHFRRRMPFMSAALMAALLVSVIGTWQYNEALTRFGRQRVQGFVEIAQSRQEAMTGVDMAGSEEKRLRADLAAAGRDIREVTARLEGADLLPEEKEKFETLLRRFSLQHAQLQKELLRASEKRADYGNALRADHEVSDKTREEIIDELYSWLKRHEDRRTGLVPSFEGDDALEQSSFTYDQALMVIVRTLFGDFDQAKRILLFYRDEAQRSHGGFANAYHSGGGDPVEWKVHVGPNVWMGIAALRYEAASGDLSFRKMALSTGEWLLKLQRDGEDWGLRGGPGESWYSTEHNLDAYAFFDMLYEITSVRKYLDAREKSFEWIMEHGADRRSGRMNRGKGDATIATDTLSWAIAAIGPDRLADIDFDPEGIMDFAEEHCRVTVDYGRPDGKTVRVTGFDFTGGKQSARGGVVSSEWTAQAIVTYRILTRHFKRMENMEKAIYYRNKSLFYLNELQKMIISSLSKSGQGKGCLPYATHANADTGHGWRTPSGHKTGSVAGTAYGILAWAGVNPFDLDSP